jgi:hypothetical protein
LHNAPTERAIRAAHDSLLVAAMDEPGVSNAPTELDGERPHDVRLAAVDLAAGKLLVRVRRHVDPNWISVEKRPMYALGLDSCAFSYEVVAEFNGNK